MLQMLKGFNILIFLAVAVLCACGAMTPYIYHLYIVAEVERCIGVDVPRGASNLHVRWKHYYGGSFCSVRFDLPPEKLSEFLADLNPREERHDGYNPVYPNPNNDLQDGYNPFYIPSGDQQNDNDWWNPESATIFTGGSVDNSHSILIDKTNLHLFTIYIAGGG